MNDHSDNNSNGDIKNIILPSVVDRAGILTLNWKDLKL